MTFLLTVPEGGGLLPSERLSFSEEGPHFFFVPPANGSVKNGGKTKARCQR